MIPFSPWSHISTKDVQGGQYLCLYLSGLQNYFYINLYLNKSGNMRNNPVSVVALKAVKVGDVEE